MVRPHLHRLTPTGPRPAAWTPQAATDRRRHAPAPPPRRHNHASRSGTPAAARSATSARRSERGCPSPPPGTSAGPTPGSRWPAAGPARDRNAPAPPQCAPRSSHPAPAAPPHPAGSRTPCAAALPGTGPWQSAPHSGPTPATSPGATDRAANRQSPGDPRPAAPWIVCRGRSASRRRRSPSPCRPISSAPAAPCGPAVPTPRPPRYSEGS